MKRKELEVFGVPDGVFFPILFSTSTFVVPIHFTIFTRVVRSAVLSGTWSNATT